MTPLSPKDLERFRSSLRAVGPHLLWLGKPGPNGYGRFTWQGQLDYVHRIAYAIAHPDWDGKRAVRSSCEDRLCVAEGCLVLTPDSGRDGKRSRHPEYRRLTDADRYAIHASPETGIALAEQYKISTTHAYNIKHDARWASSAPSVVV